MDIHPPEGHIGSFRDFIVHMSMIVLGILVALGLDSGAEVYRHHREVREARENILAEVADNKARLDEALTKAPLVVGELQAVLDATEKQMQHTSADAKDANQLSYGLVGLSTTSWESTQVAGVLNYMPFSEVQGFTKAYLMQRRFDTVQDQTVQRWLDLQRIGFIPHEQKLSSVAPERVAQIQLEAASAMSYTVTEIDFARQLSKQYQNLMDEEKGR